MSTDRQLNLAFPSLYKNTPRPIAMDLFAGAGGFSLGMEQAGFDVLVAVEWDPIHACTYAYNFPQTQVICRSVTDITVADINAAATLGWQKHRQMGCFSPHTTNFQGNQWNHQFDLVFGGPPCQGFSVMGKQNLDDERNSLIFHFLRIVCTLRPRFFVMENVPGLKSRKYKGLLAELESKFAAGGYWTKAICLNAVDFGVPQRRQRLFVIGGRYPEDGVSLERHLQPVNFRTTVKDAIADLPDIDQFRELATGDEYLLDDEYLEKINTNASDYIRFLRKQHSPLEQITPQLVSTTCTNHQGNCFDLPDFSYPRHWNPKLLTCSMQTQHRESSRQRFTKLSYGELEPVSRLRRLDWNGFSHTLRAGTDSSRGRHTSPRPIHPLLPRVISVREAARLHSFPDWFRFHYTKWHGFRQVGNSVPPLLAKGIGSAIAKTMNIELKISFCASNSESGNYFNCCLQLGNPQILKFNPSEAQAFWQK